MVQLDRYEDKVFTLDYDTICHYVGAAADHWFLMFTVIFTVLFPSTSSQLFFLFCFFSYYSSIMDFKRLQLCNKNLSIFFPLYIWQCNNWEKAATDNFHSSLKFIIRFTDGSSDNEKWTFGSYKNIFTNALHSRSMNREAVQKVQPFISDMYTFHNEKKSLSNYDV